MEQFSTQPSASHARSTTLRRQRVTRLLPLKGLAIVGLSSPFGGVIRIAECIKSQLEQKTGRHHEGCRNSQATTFLLTVTGLGLQTRKAIGMICITPVQLKIFESIWNDFGEG